MAKTKLPEMIQSILDEGRVETGEVLTLRRWFYGDGLVHGDDAEALFAANGALRGRSETFDALFVQAITDFVVYQSMPTGRVTPGQANWLIGCMGGADAHVETQSELRVLVEIMEEAHEIPTALAAFALAQVKHAAITGEGPAARGRPHFSRVVDAGDVELLARILAGAGGVEGAAVSRAEADILFDIADACSGSSNHAGWDQLFVRAIANHLLGAAVPRRNLVEVAALARPTEAQAEWAVGRSVRIDAAGADWLARRVHRDGQISQAEKALLA